MRSLRSHRWLAVLYFFFTLSVSGSYNGACAQEAPSLRPIPSGVSNAQPEAHSARKVDVRPDRGVTLIAVDERLENVLKGGDPRTLEELQLLEAQQSEVARAIEKVTVNVRQGSAQGSGVIITPDGFVLTAAHVAGNANLKAEIILHDGRRVEANTYGLNRNKDAGLMKIIGSREDWPCATLGQSSNLRVGQWCIASGHPGGWRPERGAVIRVGRILGINQAPHENSANTLFTDCTLIGGDSGGPLFSLDGKLIGIHSRIGVELADNMHVPIDVFAEDWNRLAGKEVWGVLPGYRKPAIGVVGKIGDDRPLVTTLEKSGAARKAGVEIGDLILAVNGKNISTFDELSLAVAATMPGDTMQLTVDRGGQLLRITLIVGEAAE
ncbi:MAG: trypsin-like peptidase domain-containing protein [Planctomycetales bacterium]|nr:trypsin-like peptidase domain-containing protein [Planctomycetales bacterium]